MTIAEIVLLVAGLIASVICGIKKKYTAMLISLIICTAIFLLLVATIILGWG